MNNRFHFLKLTPTADTTLNVYADAMEYVFVNDDISIPVARRQTLLAVQCNLGMWQERVKSALKDLQLSEFLNLFAGRDRGYSRK